MNIAELHKNGLLESRAAVQAALLAAGFSPEDSATLISTIRSATGPKHYTKWTEDEVAYLREAYSAGVPVAEIAIYLDRTVGVVRTMAMRRGFRRSIAE